MNICYSLVSVGNSILNVIVFQIAEPEMSFLIKFTKLDLPLARDGFCMDSVTLWQTPSGRLDGSATVVSCLQESVSQFNHGGR